MQNDTNTYGYNQWFYFSIRNMKVNTKYTFRIANFVKNNLYRKSLILSLIMDFNLFCFHLLRQENKEEVGIVMEWKLHITHLAILNPVASDIILFNLLSTLNRQMIM